MLSLLHMDFFLLFQAQWFKADSRNSLLQQGKEWGATGVRAAREMTFERRPEHSEEQSHGPIRGKAFLAEGTKEQRP